MESAPAQPWFSLTRVKARWSMTSLRYVSTCHRLTGIGRLRHVFTRFRRLVVCYCYCLLTFSHVSSRRGWFRRFLGSVHETLPAPNILGRIQQFTKPSSVQLQTF